MKKSKKPCRKFGGIPPVNVGASGIRHRIVRVFLEGSSVLACGRKRRYTDLDEAKRDARESKAAGNKHVWIITENIEVIACEEIRN